VIGSSRIGTILIVFGLALALTGVLVSIGGRFLGFLGQLPGDINIRRDNFAIYIPVATSILLSIILTLLLNLFLARR